MSAAAISLEGLIKTFKGRERPALSGISAEISAGRMTGLVGPDGAGKTTLIRLLAGLLRADGGRLRVLGLDPASQAAALHPRLGYMPQKFGLYEDLSVRENLSLHADLRGVTGRRREERFQRLLKFTALENFQRRLAGRLSGGMKQKLGLACALVGEPDLLLLDEPSVGVDPISRRELWDMVRELIDGGRAVVWATAYLDEAEKCDSVILLNQGQKLFDGPPAELRRRVEGRAWRIEGLAAEARRPALLALLREAGVTDGFIQGRNLRVVTDGRSERPPVAGATWRATPPQFEDAYVDLLGGGPKGPSALAEELPCKAADERPVIEARGLTKKFGDFVAVRDNSFQIRRGEIFGLLGPNGAGKSTTFKMMCGLLQPTAGEALVTGLSLRTASSQARERIGYMAQKFSLYDHLSVGQNLDFFSGAYGLQGRTRKNRVRLMLDIFDLGPYRRSNAGALPPGFKQRLALACAVMHQPDVLFLDEPTSGVDPVTRREFWLHINSLATRGVTIMVTTHFMDEAEYCDRIGLIYQGLNIATGSPDQLKDLARSPELPEPTLEDAFIALVEKNDRPGERNRAV